MKTRRDRGRPAVTFTRSAGILVVLIGLLSACSPAEEDPSVTFPSSAPDAETTTTESPSSSTTSTTSATSEALAFEARADIENVVIKDWEVWNDCTFDPAICDPEAVFATTRNPSGPYYAAGVEVIKTRQEAGEVTRQPEGRPDQNFINVETIEVADSLESATAIRCVSDGRARYTREPDGNLVLVEGSDAEGFVRARYDLLKTDNKWLIDDFELVESTQLPDGEILCDGYEATP